MEGNRQRNWSLVYRVVPDTHFDVCLCADAKKIVAQFFFGLFSVLSVIFSGCIHDSYLFSMEHTIYMAQRERNNVARTFIRHIIIYD